jgi:peptide/nickel transport system ATP-binding protein
VTILSVRGLMKHFRVGGGRQSRNFVAVDDVSFELPTGGSLAIVGESGSGKSTIARMLTGLEAPTAGTIVVAGRDRSRPDRRAAERRRRGEELQIVFQDPYTSMDPRQTVGSAVDEVLRLHGTLGRDGRATRARELAESVGLDERHLASRPGALSGGQRQRAAIARALAADPKVLVLDEAVSALDVSIQAQVINLLSDIQARTGISYVFISHDLAVVRQIAQQVVVLRRGRVVENGPTDAVLDDPQHAFTQALLAAVPGPGWVPRRRGSADEP